jgi:membrane-bound lytic murein transglycosylase D
MKKTLAIFFLIVLRVYAFAQNVNSPNNASDPIADALDSLQYLNFFSCNLDKTDSCIAAAGQNLPSGAPVFDELVYEARLAKLDALSPFDLVFNPQVKAYIDLYANRKRNLVARAISLSAVYFPLFEEKLALYHLPMELKYLAIVESALNPRAISKSGASGLWQFMYKTGLMYGLEVNSYADMRRDPIKSTEAACRYLSDLYRALGDWQMVLAAYNCGPGTLAKAIRRSGGKSTYWELRPFLPTETQGYVPAFIAVNYVMNFAREHHLYAAPFKSDFFLTDSITVKQPVSFAQIASVTGIPVEDIQFLNPVYKSGFVPATPNLSTIELPQAAVALFMLKESEIYALRIHRPPAPLVAKNSGPIPEKIYHKVKKGENLNSIAARHGVTASEIKKWNRIKKHPHKGQMLVIYLPKKSQSISPEGIAMAQPVRDSLSETSLMSQPPVEDVNEDFKNDSSRAATTGKSSSPVNTGKEVFHVVQKGDTLWKISNLYKISSVEELRRMNKLAPNQKLVPGTKIKVSSGSGKS